MDRYAITEIKPDIPGEDPRTARPWVLTDTRKVLVVAWFRTEEEARVALYAIDCVEGRR